MPSPREMVQKLAKPPVLIAAGAVAGVGLIAGTLRLLGENWLFAVIVALLAALVVLLLVLVWAVYAREREDRVGRGTHGESVAAWRQQREEERATSSLEEGFRRALAVIRESPAAQELPWYLVMGPAGGGKSSLLRSSGLELPAAVARLVEDGPTQSCSWWLTNRAILVDVAGRYSSSKEATDRREWRQLLSLLRKHGPRPALNGILLALPAPLFLSSGGEQLEEEAAELRRRLNEAKDFLGVDPPIYLVITQADRIPGFAEAAVAVTGSRLQETLGWTNDVRNPHDMGDAVRAGLDGLCARLELLLPELLMREPEPGRRSRLFLLPQEIGVLGARLSSYVRRAFAPALYDETPFLRGVYLTSAMRGGSLVSPVLERLGWSGAPELDTRSLPPGGWFTRDLFRHLILDEEEQGLAAAVERVGPRTRALVLGLAGAASLALVVSWGIAFSRNWSLIHRIQDGTATMLTEHHSLAALDGLRATLVGADEAGQHTLNRMGLRGPLDRAIQRGERAFRWDFGREYEQPAKQHLQEAAGQSNDEAFSALQELATDVGWLASRAGEQPAFRPALVQYADVGSNAQDRKAFAGCYDAFVRWSPDGEIQSRIDTERARLDEEAPRLLELGRLERWCATHPEAAPPIRYEDFGLPRPRDPGVPDQVLGCYTRKFWDGRLLGLITGLERTGSASQSNIARFRQSYASHFEESWRRFLIDTPMPPVANANVKGSSYLDLVQAIDQNTRAQDVFTGATPEWIGVLHAVRSQQPAGDKKTAPWTQYMSSLEEVSADVDRAQVNSQAAYQMAIAASKGQDTSFKRALSLVQDKLVKPSPTPGSHGAEVALQSVLAMPILNGFSVVLRNAAREVDAMWKDRIASRYHPPLSPDQQTALAQDVSRFRQEVLEPFYLNGRPLPVLGDRSMPLGSRFVGFLSGRSGGAGGGGQAPSGPQIVRLDGVPSEVTGSSGAVVTARDLSLSCGSRPEQRFEYFDGTGSKTFTWTADCQDVLLEVSMRWPDGRETSIRRDWTGPFAFSEFLDQGQSTGGGVYEWVLSDPKHPSTHIAVRYRRHGGEQIMKYQRLASKGVPSSIGN